MGRLARTEGLTEVQQEILGTVRDFVDREILPVATGFEHADSYPHDIVEGLKKLGLFGTRFTMQGKFYPEFFSKAGIELIVPDPDDQDYIHDKYMNELVPGIFLPETREKLLAIVDRLKAKIDIDGIILAGTELPLILRDPAHNGIPFLDTMKIHAEAAVAEMLS